VTPRRWTPNIRVWAYRYLALRDGEQCAICHAIPTTKKKSRLRTNALVSSTTKNHKTQEQHHTGKASSTTKTQNAPRTNSLVSPTTQNENDLRTTPIVSSTPQFTLDIDHIDGNHKNDDPDNLRLLCRRCNVATSNRNAPRRNLSSDLRERERKGGRPSTRIARKDANYRDGSSEMQANLLYEDPFRRWLMRKVITEGGYDRSTAIAEGAELVGCSPLTTARYITKLTSPLGPLMEMDDALYHRILVLKPHLQKPDDKQP
jgi:hypothetical protein